MSDTKINDRVTSALQNIRLVAEHNNDKSYNYQDYNLLLESSNDDNSENGHHGNNLGSNRSNKSYSKNNVTAYEDVIELTKIITNDNVVIDISDLSELEIHNIKNNVVINDKSRIEDEVCNAHSSDHNLLDNDTLNHGTLQNNIDNSNNDTPSMLSENTVKKLISEITSLSKYLHNNNINNNKTKSHSLEENIIDELKPYLKSWLDKNLPDIVSKIVQTEITAIISSSGVNKNQ